MKIVYLCDGKVEACKKTGCIYCHLDGICKRTTDPRHAKNGAVASAKPPRFEQYNNTTWVEVEDSDVENR